MTSSHHMLLLLPLLLASCAPLTSAPANLAADITTPSRAVINSHGVLLINNRPVFPIGFTMPPPADGKTPTGKGALAELAEAGATFLRTGPMAAPWDQAMLAKEQRYLDEAAKVGLWVMPTLREYSGVRENDPKEAQLRALINRFKDHPALGAWKGADEPEWGKQPIPPLKRTYDIIRELDPHHPVFIVQAPRGTIDAMRAYDSAYDITGADIYPISYPPGGHSIEPNKHLSMVGDFTDRMMEVARVDNKPPKPVWMVLQVTFSGTIKPGKTLRMPTFPQTRYMTYQAIIHGARGLLYFGGHIEKSLPERDKPLGWNWTHWNKVLRPVIEEIGSHSPLYPALLAPNAEVKITCSDPKVELLARQVGDDLFLLAAKREGDMFTDTKLATFSGIPQGYTLAKVLYEDPRTVNLKDGKLADWFAPFDVHVYHLKK